MMRGGCLREVTARAIRFPVDAVLDFLVEDRCGLCGRPHRPGTLRRRRLPVDGGPADDAPGDIAPADGPARYLAEPVSVRCLWGAVRVVNHPVCGDCAEGLVVARSSGVLGGDLPGGVGPVGGEDPSDGESSLGRPPCVPAVGTIAVVSPFMTTDGVLKIIHLLKFNSYLGLAQPVGRAVAWALRRFADSPGGFGPIIPTPMDERSLRRRGFNQSERIARVVAGELAAPLPTDVLLKTVRTQRQSLTPREMRLANVRGAFSCPAAAAPLVAGRSVVLIDDLVTSGATARACAGPLLGCGAASVTVACFGRAL